MNVAILSSSCENIDDYYINLAKTVSSDLASRNFDLVFGGCSTSMMGECYKEFINQGRNVYSFTTVKYTGDMANLPQAKHCIRETTFDLKKSLFENSDLILALAGGFGTLSEILSFIEENRSNDKEVPIVIYDTNHYYYYLLEQLKVMDDNKFLNTDITKWVTIINSHEEWLDYIDKFNYKKGMSR